MMKVFSQNSREMLLEYSLIFIKNYMELLRKHPKNKFVNSNRIYQDYISNKEHVHMNSTRWSTLSEFLFYLKDNKIILIEDNENNERREGTSYSIKLTKNYINYYTKLLKNNLNNLNEQDLISDDNNEIDSNENENNDDEYNENNNEKNNNLTNEIINNIIKKNHIKLFNNEKYEKQKLDYIIKLAYKNKKDDDTKEEEDVEVVYDSEKMSNIEFKRINNTTSNKRKLINVFNDDENDDDENDEIDNNDEKEEKIEEKKKLSSFLIDMNFKKNKIDDNNKDKESSTTTTSTNSKPFIKYSSSSSTSSSFPYVPGCILKVKSSKAYDGKYYKRKFHVHSINKEKKSASGIILDDEKSSQVKFYHDELDTVVPKVCSLFLTLL